VDLKLDARCRAVLDALAAFCAERGVEAYATGGFLRDAIIGRRVHDIDVSVAGDALALGRQLADVLGGPYFPLDEEHGQARVLLPEGGLHVDLIPLRDAIEADLRGRDYTIDALGARLEEAASGRATVIDPAGGLADLAAGLLRATGESAFHADPLRLLRGPRIATELGFTIDPGTEAMIRRNAARLTESAPERQRDELVRIFSAAHAAPGVRLLDTLGLLPVVLPEMEVTRGVEQPKEHYHDVFGHSIATVESLDWLMAENEPEREPEERVALWRDLWGALEWWPDARGYLHAEVVGGTTRVALLKLCGFLHDIGKPETKSFDENGRMRFFGHGETGAHTAGQLMRRLRFSARETAIVERMITAHLRPVQMAQQGPPSRRAVYKFFRDTGDGGILTLFLSLADHLGTVGPRVRREGFRAHVAVVSYILEMYFRDETVAAPPKILSGDELMAALRLSPGALVGELLEVVREARAAGEISTREEALALARRALEERARGSGEASG
jgi:putative nucleotidyltransferase with HDIG domain